MEKNRQVIDRCYILLGKTFSDSEAKILGVFISRENATSSMDTLKEEHWFSKLYIEEHLFVDR